MQVSPKRNNIKVCEVVKAFSSYASHAIVLRSSILANCSNDEKSKISVRDFSKKLRISEKKEKPQPVEEQNDA